MNGAKFECVGMRYDDNENYIEWEDDSGSYELYNGYDEDQYYYIDFYADEGNYSLEIAGDLVVGTEYINSFLIDSDIARKDQLSELPLNTALIKYLTDQSSDSANFYYSSLVDGIKKSIFSTKSYAYTWDGETSGLQTIGDFYRIADVPKGLTNLHSIVSVTTGLYPLKLVLKHTETFCCFTNEYGTAGVIITTLNDGWFHHHSVEISPFTGEWDVITSSEPISKSGIYVSAGVRKITIDAVDFNTVVLPSATSGSTKKFKITVDDTGTLSATEVT